MFVSGLNPRIPNLAKGGSESSAPSYRTFHTTALDVVTGSEIPTSSCPTFGLLLTENFLFLQQACVTYGKQS
jgi:hypothetical protein